MGFWQGVNEGLTYNLEQKAREDEQNKAFEIRKQERAEERSWALQDRLQERITATFPLLLERKNTDRAEAQKRAALGGFFQERLGDVDEQTRTAFTNLAVQDTAYSESLMATVQGLEEKTGTRLKGTDIIRITDIFEKTKPEGVSIEDWTRQAANLVVTEGSGFNYDETFTRLLSGDLDEEGLLELQSQILSPPTTSLGLLPDFNTSVVVGADPAKRNAIRSGAMEEIKTRYQEDVTRLTEEYDAYIANAQPIPEELQAAKSELDRIAGIRDTEGADAAEAAMWNIYAPQVLPSLAEQQPEVRSMFPEYFSTTKKYKYTLDGQLLGAE